MTEVKLSESQLAGAKNAFKFFDKKNEDKIKVGDIEQALKKLGHNIKPDWLEKIEHTIDAEGTGYIKLDEFCGILRKKVQDDEDERELREMFRILDKEKRGEVNTNELRWILKNLGDDLTEADIDDMIADVDTDGSGWVDYNEFSKLMQSD
jgi:calmodulin